MKAALNIRSRRFASLPWLAVGLSLTLWLTGCGDHDHTHSSGGSGGHRHDSAHGGVAVELGNHQFHLDFLHDPVNGTLSAWVMDAHAENFVRVPLRSFEIRLATADQTNTLSLSAVAQASTGETVGDTSQFRGEAPWLKGLTSFTAQIDAIEIRGQRFSNLSFRYPAGR